MPSIEIDLAGKFVRRYRTGVAAAGMLVLALAAFALTATLQARSVARARDEAEAQAAKAEAMNTFLRDMLTSPDPWATVTSWSPPAHHWSLVAVEPFERLPDHFCPG